MDWNPKKGQKQFSFVRFSEDYLKFIPRMQKYMHENKHKSDQQFAQWLYINFSNFVRKKLRKISKYTFTPPITIDFYNRIFQSMSTRDQENVKLLSLFLLFFGYLHQIFVFCFSDGEVYNPDTKTFPKIFHCNSKEAKVKMISLDEKMCKNSKKDLSKNHVWTIGASYESKKSVTFKELCGRHEHLI